MIGEEVHVNVPLLFSHTPAIAPKGDKKPHDTSHAVSRSLGLSTP